MVRFWSSFAIALTITVNVAAVPRAFPKRAGGPAVAFATDRVRATGATPGATLYFVNVSIQTAEGMLHVTNGAGSAIANAGGEAEFLATVHTRSVWLIVDAEKGYTVAAPTGMMLREMPFPGTANDENGELQRLLLRRFSVEVFLVRPNSGIWSAYFRDGGELDADGEPNGENRAELRDLKPLETQGGGPPHLANGDYLFLVDRNTLEFHVARRGAQ